MAQVPTVNAKNIQFDQPGAGVTGYGINAQNLYPKLTKLYGARTDKAGGSKSIWDAMVNNTNKSLARSQSPVALDFQKFLNTGQMPANPTPQFQKYAAESLDYGLRETGRAQQHKPVNFFTKYLLDPIIQTGLGMIPGVGVPLAMAYGGIKGGVENGFGGALTGALSGYGAGKLGSGIGSAVSSTGGFASSFANPGAFGHNLVGQLNPFTVRSGSALGGMGNVAGSVGSAIPHIGGSAANAGGSMGAFSDFLSPVTDFMGNFNYGNGGNLISDVVKGGINYFGQQSALDQQSQAAERAFANSQFTPYNINTPGGSATFTGNNASASLSPQAQKLLGDYNSVMGQDLTAFNKFNPNNYSQNMYKTLSNLKAPGVTAANNNLLSDVYNRGQWGGTVGAQDIYSADMANNLQDQAMRLQSQQAGASESDRLFNQYMKSAAAYHSLLNSPNDFITQGLNAGGQRSAANTSANQYPWLAANNSADASAAFWSSLGNTAAGLMQNVGNNSAVSNNVRNTYRSTMGPNGYFVDMPA